MIDTENKNPEVTTKAEEKPAERAVSSSILTSTPQPFMIGRVLGEQYLDDFYTDEGITMSISTFKCNYIMSRPNGISNAALSIKYLCKYDSTAAASARRGG